MRHRRLIALICVGLIALPSVSSCSKNVQHAAGAGHPPTLSATGRQLEQVLGGLLPDSVGDQLQLRMATRQEALSATCMSAHHLTYLPRPARSLVDTVTNTDFTSLTYAQTYGFGVTAFPNLVGADPNETRLLAMVPAARAAYEAQLNACETAASKRTDVEFDVDAANQLFNQLDAVVRGSRQFGTAESQWRMCASALGYHEVDRLHLIDSFQNRLGTVKNPLVAAAAAAGSPGDAQVQTLADRDPAFQELRRGEITAAVATFPCSEQLDATYLSLYRTDEAVVLSPAP